MSVSSLVNKNRYLGNDTTNEYDYTFKIFQDSDLKVFVLELATSTETELTSSDFSVSGVGRTNGGVVSLVGPRDWLDPLTNNLLTGWVLVIKRSLELVQETDIRNQGDFLPEVHEDAFDRGVMVEQQLQEQLDRTVGLAETATDDFNPQLPANLEGNPGAVFIVNEDGDGFEIGPTADQVSGAQGSAAAAAASAAAALVSEQNADASEALAQDWAIKTDGPVTPPGDEYSSKEYAVGVQRRGLADGGSSKDWANYLGGTVDNTEFSAKKYAQDAAAAVVDIDALIIELEALTGVQVELGFSRNIGQGTGSQDTFPIGGSYNGMAIFPTLNGMIPAASEYSIVGSNVVFNYFPDITQKVGVIGLKSAQGDLFVLETLTGLVNNSNTTFTYVTEAQNVDSVVVYKAGQLLHKFKYSNDLDTKTIVTDVAPNFGQYMLAIVFTGPTEVSCKQESLGYGNLAGTKVRFGPLTVKPFNIGSVWPHVNGVMVDPDSFELVDDLYIEVNTGLDNTQEVEVVTVYIDSEYYQAFESRALTAAENSSRIVRLKCVPAVPENLKLLHQDASFLVYDVDFSITDDKLTLLGTARANAISTGEYLQIEYKV